MGEHVVVIDTGPLMGGFTADEDAKCLIPPEVVEELDRHGVSSYEILERGLVTSFPSSSAVDLVREHAEQTGDLDVLSPADIELLALAGEKEAVLVTDDYAIQNVASKLGVQVQVFEQEGIERTLEWEWYCAACRSYAGDRKGECPICATELKRRPRRR